MANVTEITLVDVLKYHFYWTQGSCILLANAFILGTVCHQNILRDRKEFILIAALALADLIYGYTNLSAGLYRLYLIHSYQANQLVTSWECVTQTPHGLVNICQIISNSMLVCISLDRLLCVSLPLQYFGFNRFYAYKMIGAFYGITVANVAYFLFMSYSNEKGPVYEAVCLGSFCIGDEFATKWWRLFRQICNIASIAIYIPIPIIYWFHTRKIASDAQNQASELKFQKKLLKSLAISTFFTLFCNTVPQSVKSMIFDMEIFGPISRRTMLLLEPYGTAIEMMNPLANVFIYAINVKEMRRAMACFIRGKQLPVNWANTMLAAQQAKNKNSALVAKPATRAGVIGANKRKSKSVVESPRPEQNQMHLPNQAPTL